LRTRDTEAIETPALAAMVSTVGGPAEVVMIVPPLIRHQN